MFIFIRMIMIVMFIVCYSSVQVQAFDKEANFLKVIHQKMVNREETFSLICDPQIAVFYENNPSDLVGEVLSIKKNTSEALDFLRYNIKAADVSLKKDQGKSIFYFRIQYYDRSNDLQAVNSKIAEIIKALRIKADVPEVRVRKIHDYIALRSNFYAGRGKDGASESLLNQSASSRGYALLAYKMLYESGVPVRIIEGTLDGRAHFWNIVELDGKWYHLDIAADDLNTSSIIPIRYQFFLVGMETVGKTHKLGDFYYSVDFGDKIVINDKDYRNRKQLILAGQAAQVREKSGIGIFDEPYHNISDSILDFGYRLNDNASNALLDALEPIFGL